MTDTFVPYWLIHEPGKTHGIATVDLDSAITPERAVEVWREGVRQEWAGIVDWDSVELSARLITEPLIAS